jgi:inosose dehydratase
MADKMIGIQSWCFRNFKDNEIMLPLLKKCGAQAIELCGVHADFSKPETFAGVFAIYKKHGVKIVSTGVNGITGDYAADKPKFEFLKGCGARHMSIDFGLDNLDTQIKIAEKLAEEFDVTLGIHNHGGCHWLGSVGALQWVFKKCSKRIGLSLDTALALDAGENPIRIINKFRERVLLIHVKDFVFDRARAPKDVVVGTGNLDLRAMKMALAEIGFNGQYIVEYEGEPEDPMPALMGCVQAIKKDLL